MKQYKYYVKGTVRGTRSYDDYTEDIDSQELCLYLEEINEMFDKDPDDELAQYISKYEKIYGVITEIWVGVKQFGKELYSLTEVSATRELTQNEKNCLLEYLTGQFSDGYGEGLEQREFNSYTDTDVVEEWDEEEQETYMEDVETRVDMYLHLWNSKNFNLEFVDYEEKPNKVSLAKPKVTKPKCKLIGQDGNIFNLIGIASRSLRRAGLADKAKEMSEKVYHCGSYSEALSIIMDYVEVE